MHGKNFTSQELIGHRITVSSPGPVYKTILTDLETGLQIMNATAIMITGDISETITGHLQATVRLRDEEGNEDLAEVAVYNAHLEAVVTQVEAEQEHVTDPVLPAIQVEEAQ